MCLREEATNTTLRDVLDLARSWRRSADYSRDMQSNLAKFCRQMTVEQAQAIKGDLQGTLLILEKAISIVSARADNDQSSRAPCVVDDPETTPTNRNVEKARKIAAQLNAAMRDHVTDAVDYTTHQTSSRGRFSFSQALPFLRDDPATPRVAFRVIEELIKVVEEQRFHVSELSDRVAALEKATSPISPLHI